MGINFGAIGGPLTSGMVQAYMLKLQRDMAQKQAAQAQEMDFADFVRRQQYMQQLQAQDPVYQAQLAANRRAAGLSQVEAAQRLAALTGQGQTITPDVLQQAFPGLNLPKFQGPFADVPGSGAPAFQGGVKPLTIAAPRDTEPIVNVPGIGPMRVSEAEKIIGAEGVRNILGVREGVRPEAPQARLERVSSELRALYQQAISADTPETAATAARNYNARLAEAKRFGVGTSFTPLNVAQVVADARKKAAGAQGGDLTPLQRNTVWQQSLNQAAMEILGKRGSGLTFTVGPDGSLIPQLGSGQSPLTDPEIARINARAQEIYNQRIALPPRGFSKTAPPKPGAVPMTRNEALRRQAAGARVGQARPVPAGTVPLNAAQYAGQIVQGPNGKRYRSDGKQWFEVK